MWLRRELCGADEGQVRGLSGFKPGFGCDRDRTSLRSAEPDFAGDFFYIGPKPPEAGLRLSAPGGRLSIPQQRAARPIARIVFHLFYSIQFTLKSTQTTLEPPRA
jgi:hypothetical protein